MKKLSLIALLIAASTANAHAATNAQERRICNDKQEVAEKVMRHVQAGAKRSNAYDLVPVRNDYYNEVVRKAYRVNVFNDDKGRREAIKDFGRRIKNECLRDFN